MRGLCAILFVGTVGGRDTIFRFLRGGNYTVQRPCDSVLLFRRPVPPDATPTVDTADTDKAEACFPDNGGRIPVFFSHPMFATFDTGSLSTVRGGVVTTDVTPDKRV